MDNELLLFDRLEIIKTTIAKYGEDNFYLSFSGGKGAVPGIFFGALLMGIINNSMNLMYIDSYWQQVVKGLIIVVSVLYSIYNSNKK